jgi:hypothetical protein
LSWATTVFTVSAGMSNPMPTKVVGLRQVSEPHTELGADALVAAKARRHRHRRRRDRELEAEPIVACRSPVNMFVVASGLLGGRPPARAG